MKAWKLASMILGVLVSAWATVTWVPQLDERWVKYQAFKESKAEVNTKIEETKYEVAFNKKEADYQFKKMERDAYQDRIWQLEEKYPEPRPTVIEDQLRRLEYKMKCTEEEMERLGR